MENPSSTAVQSLNASGSSRVHVGNSYNITHHHRSGSGQDGAKKYLDALRSTNPRDDKARIEQTNGGLLKDSYVWVLDSPEFITWRDESESGRLLWIRGDPGKGKTMLLSGLINELQPSTRLESPQNRNTISYFFCQATNSGLNNYAAILKGLIYLLAIQHPALVAHLDDRNGHDKNGHDKDHWNSKVSLEGTFRKMVGDSALGEIYLLVDALDECVEDLPLLLALISSTSSRAKWIVTSRNRCEIGELFGETSSKLALSLELHETSVSEAVNNYISYRTRQLADRKKLKKSIVQKIHGYLSEHAHGTFLWVALVCQRLERCRAWEIPNQLLEFPQGLNQLYAQMMDQIRKSDSSDLYIRVLALASTVFRPLTFSELITMENLNMDEETLPDLIVECGSFLTTKGNTVVFVHKSAKDFLLKESGTLLFQSGLAHHQYDLFQRCIAMLQSLHQDIYGLVYPGVSLDEALRNCPDPDPLENMEYSCVFWADHMQEAYKLSIQEEENGNIPGIDTVHDFINEKFLFWLEALALCQNLPAALKALAFVGNLPVQGQASYKILIEDALRFSHYFCSIIESYPLQIYASGLLFSPNNSLIRRRFKQYTSEIFSEGPKVDDEWSPIRSIFEPQDAFDLETMTFAPTSQMLVVTTYESLTRWHVNQEPVPDVIRRNDFRGEERIAPSSDGKWLAIIASGSGSKTAQSSAECELQVHDLTLNRIAWRQELDSPVVLGMTIAPDSQCLLVCHGSLFVIYDISGGIRRRYPLEQALPRLYPVYFSFSSDCSWVAFHMHASTQIWVLNLRTGEQHKNANWKDILPINDKRFIPSTYLLMFCDGGDNIYLWNVVEQKCEIWSHIEYSFSRLAISQSDSWMLLGGKDGLVICDRAYHRVRRVIGLPDPLGVQEIAISFDDQIIACATASELWILDANTLLADKPRTTRDAHEKFHISDNGQLIAYNLGRSIEVWDALASDMLCSLAIDDVIHQSIRTITFSPKDRYLLVGGLQLILGWDLADDSSQRVSGDFDSGPIAVSDKRRNGDRWVAARRSMGGVSVWNITTEKRTRNFRQPDNRSQEAASIAFADSQLGVLWCSSKVSSRDEVFLLYNLETGEQLSRIKFPYYPVDQHWYFGVQKPRPKLSLSGTLAMIRPRLGSRSFFINLSTDGDGIEVYNLFDRFFLLDDSTVSTNQGMFDISSFESISSQSSEISTVDSFDLVRESEERPARIILDFSEYSRDPSGDWIQFDNKPLLWRPAQYRDEIIAIGPDYVFLDPSYGVQFIRFAKDANKVLYQAIQNLS
ncbi:Vegetative incompatibility protein HET-E-1 [Fusarium oxysporum f. sp. conglutinans]|nr:Vegetative incompatibility protein HET-E-1 [Fusarium oxysporum f. sp. conglutinans]